MKILISDKIDDSTLSILKDNNIDFSYQPEISPPDLLSSIPGYQALIVRSRTKVTQEVIGAGENLKVIGRVGSGVDNINMEAARKRRIVVVNAPDANSQAVAELTVALMLSLLRKLSPSFSSMKDGLWLKKELTGRELAEKTVGIIGYGRIGQKVERLVSSFGAYVLISSRSYQTATLAEIFERSDIVTLHLALTPETKGYVTKDLLALLKPTAFFINSSRGEIVDEEALYTIVNEKKIAGAALDVFWQEPLPADSRWRKLDNVILQRFDQIDSAIQTYYIDKNKLPDNFEVLLAEQSYLTNEELKDPITNVIFDYKIFSSNSYQLCANFRLSNINKNINNENMGYDNNYKERWPHKAGYQCLKQRVDLFDKVKTAPVSVPVRD